jgi:hypothetical protein
MQKSARHLTSEARRTTAALFVLFRSEARGGSHDTETMRRCLAFPRLSRGEMDGRLNLVVGFIKAALNRAMDS